MQSAKLDMMRQSGKEPMNNSDEVLILSFDDVYKPVSRNNEIISYYEPLGYFSIVLISFIPSFTYLSICFFYKKLNKRR